MSIKDKFNDDEWFLLSSTPALISASMSAAESSGVIGTVKELSAGMKSTVSAIKDYPDSELIQELLKKAENWGDAKEKIGDYRERSKSRLEAADIKTPEALQTQMLKDVRETVALVDDRCSAEEAQAYKNWSVTVAKNVAVAAKEGGNFFGFGGTAISDSEKALMAEIEGALGVESDVFLA